MATLVFDIETIGEQWDTMDEVTQHTLTRWIDVTAKNVADREKLLLDVKNGLGFSPLTGSVVAIAVYDIERAQGAVYYQSEYDTDEVRNNWRYKVRSEAEMLSEFWAGASHYDTFVTFNGRGFDAPFLVHRSVVNEIHLTKNLLEGRYPYQQKNCRHVDLQDELTFFGAMYRRPSLHLFCRAYGIESPKQGVSGDDVAELFQLKKFRDIADYNVRDVIATTALYERWMQYGVQTGDDEGVDIYL
jgi:DNA polymerase elongation subunit (family B)